MKIERAPGAEGPMIRGFSGGGFRIDDNVYTALLITPRRAEGWAPPPIDTLDEAALAPVITLDPPPEFILLGTGARLIHPPRALVNAVEARGIGIEAMDSRAAARAWSVLRQEGRWVVGALYPF